jgi:hypothetical protein
VYSDPRGVKSGWIVNGPGVTNGLVNGTDTLLASVSIEDANGNSLQDGQSYTFTSPSPEVTGSTISFNTNTWTFGADGVLTMPDGVNGGNGAINFTWEGNNWASISSSESTLNLYSLDVVSGNPKTNVRIGFDVELTTNLLDSAYTWTFGSDGTLKVPGTIWAQASDNGSIVFSDDGSTDHGSLKVDGGHNMVISAESNFYIKRAGQDRLGITDTNTTLMAGTDLVLKSNKNATEKVLTLGADGNLTLPEGGTITYTPATASDWAGTPPITIQEAIDRLAAAVKALNGSGA